MLKKQKLLWSVLLVFVFFSALLFFSNNWMFYTWPEPTAEELLYLMKSPIGGTNHETLIDFALKCVLPAIAFLIVAVLVLSLSKKYTKHVKKAQRAVILLSILLFVFTIGKLWIKMDLGIFFENQLLSSKFIERHYVDPKNVSLSFPEKKRNLIVIFLESMEIAFADEKSGGAFEKNPISELTRIANENEDFRGNSDTLNGAFVMPGGSWSIAALFSHTSALPLKVSIGRNDMYTQESFFKGVTALGDILKENGYRQTFMLGADATFGGLGLYYKDHGNFDMYDYNEAKASGKIPKDYRVWWGFEDKRLIEFAKKRLAEIAAEKEPFHFSVFTCDTHFEDGYVCTKCPKDFGADQYSNVLSCSSRQINEFLEWIKTQSFYENTTVVIVGDHLTMDKDYCKDIDEGYERKTYTAFINAAAAPQRTDKITSYTTLDMFPTLLASLGVIIEGDRLGLGTNLFSAESTLIETYGYTMLKNELAKKSELMERLGDIKETPKPKS